MIEVSKPTNEKITHYDQRICNNDVALYSFIGTYTKALGHDFLFDNVKEVFKATKA